MSAASEHQMDTRLTKTRRREVCIHEAAHSVIGAMGGANVHAVAVAPVGATHCGPNKWIYEGAEGIVCDDALGVCVATWASYARFSLRWCDTNGVIEQEKFRQVLKAYGEFGRGVAAAARQAVRADVCLYLAGPIADALVAEAEVEVHLHEKYAYDTYKAECLAWCLPFRNEFEHALSVTERALRQPDVWRMVLRLADELEQFGEMGRSDESYGRLQSLLPSPIPNWPPSPRAQEVAFAPFAPP